MSQHTLTAILVEVPSVDILLNLKSGNLDTYGDDFFEFKFKQYSPIRIKRYPDKYFLYVLYSEEELRELYENVDMTHRMEPVDYLNYFIDEYGGKAFQCDEGDMLTKIGEFEVLSFEDFENKKEAAVVSTDTYSYVLDEVFREEHEARKKNYILVFPTEESMLSCLSLLVHVKVSADCIKVGKLFPHWSLAVSGITNEVERLLEVREEDDIETIQHTKEILPGMHGFTEERNDHAREILARAASKATP